MSKWMHLVYIVLWSHLMVFCVDSIYYDDNFGLFHVIGLVVSGVCAGLQIAGLIVEINEGE